MRQHSILLVDEDEIFRTVYARALEDAGYTVFHAGDCSSALSSLDDNAIDLVISEVLLPGRNGLKLVKDIRAKSTISLPIILLTILEAVDIGLYQSLQQALGVRAYLVKQKSTPLELITAVNYNLQ